MTPLCLWRGPPLDEAGTVKCRSPLRRPFFVVVTPEDCQVCPTDICNHVLPAMLTPEGGPAIPVNVTAPEPRGPCVHLGADTGQLRECPSCQGTVRQKVFECSHPAHGETVIRECQVCPDWQPRPDPAV
jgi:hypothetical protein